MKLTAFSVQRYRSISQAHKLRLASTTILVGPNNEGKSNILRAMVVGMRLLSRAGRVRVSRGRLRSGVRDYSQDYEWERDFPIELQQSSKEARTILDYDFELNEAERNDFHELTGTWLNSALAVRLMVGRQNVEVRILKRGPPSARLNDQRDAIAEFVGKRINLEHIPAHRTAQEVEGVVTDMLRRELDVVEDSEKFQAARRQMDELQQPVLDRLGTTLQATLREFLSDVREVRIERSERNPITYRHQVRVIVDDGSPTDLNFKGDGVQSLAAISLIRHVSQEVAAGRELVLAIEEPESHLHPRAIHRMRDVLKEIADRQQVIITTHSPLFIDRASINNNIIVRDSVAMPASNIAALRDALGVRIADNLAQAEVVLVVEGETDRVILTALLPHTSQVIRDALRSGGMAIEVSGGASGIVPKLIHLRDSLCTFHVFADHDEEGIRALEKAREAGLIEHRDQTMASCPGMRISELEDLVDPSIYAATIQDRYHVDLGRREFRGSGRKWSDRMERAFHSCGQMWDGNTERLVKMEVATLVASRTDSALHPERRPAYDALVSALDQKIADRQQG